MKVEGSLALPVDPEQLWPWIARPERLGEWIAEVESFEAVPPGDLAEGSRLIVHLPRGRSPIEARVEHVERSRTLVLRAGGLPNDLEVLLTFRLHQADGGSELTVRAEAELTGMMIFAETMIASRARAKVRSWMEELRTRVSHG